MNSWEATKTRVSLVAVGLLFLCPGFLIYFSDQFLQENASRSWPSVPGQVTDLVAKGSFNRERKSREFVGKAEYRYTVEGKEFTSDQTELGPGVKRSTEAEALADVGKYQRGMKVDVFHDPKNPDVGVLEPGFPRHHLILLCMLLAGTAIGALSAIYLIPKWIKNRSVFPPDSASPNLENNG